MKSDSWAFFSCATSRGRCRAQCVLLEYNIKHICRRVHCKKMFWCRPLGGPFCKKTCWYSCIRVEKLLVTGSPSRCKEMILCEGFGRFLFPTCLFSLPSLYLPHRATGSSRPSSVFFLHLHGCFSCTLVLFMNIAVTIKEWQGYLFSVAPPPTLASPFPS